MNERFEGGELLKFRHLLQSARSSLEISTLLTRNSSTHNVGALLVVSKLRLARKLKFGVQTIFAISRLNACFDVDEVGSDFVVRIFALFMRFVRFDSCYKTRQRHHVIEKYLFKKLTFAFSPSCRLS